MRGMFRDGAVTPEVSHQAGYSFSPFRDVCAHTDYH